MQFKDVLGLEKTKQKLQLSFQNQRIAHAQLFNGKRGSGKLALAIAYARLLNCTSENCESCVKFSKLSHPDLHIIFPVIKTVINKTPNSADFLHKWKEEFLKNPYFSLDDWMALYKQEFLDKPSDKNKEPAIYAHQINEINRKLSLKIYSAQYRIVLIWMPEKMNMQASNKLLKVLEEPPKKTIIILVSEDKSKLLKTIISRLQILEIPSYSVMETINGSGFEKTEEFLSFCKLSTGDMGEVLNYNLEKTETDSFLLFSDLMRSSYSKNFIKITELTEMLSGKTRKQQIDFLKYSLDFLRDCLVFNYSEERLVLMSNKEKDFLKKFAQFVNNNNSIYIIEEFEVAIKNIARNANSKIVLFKLCIKLTKLLKLKSKFVEE